MSNVNLLIDALKGQVERIRDEQSALDKTDELSAVFEEAIKAALRDIKAGADSDDFRELAVINFVMMTAELNYDIRSVKLFVEQLKPQAHENVGIPTLQSTLI